jgi:SAM-dependent methyltransferase
MQVPRCGLPPWQGGARHPVAGISRWNHFTASSLSFVVNFCGELVGSGLAALRKCQREQAMKNPMPAAAFKTARAANPAPWQVGPDDQDTQKYQAMLASLPSTRYRHVLEVGCGTGLLSAALAQRCDRLLGIDLAQAAISQAQARLQRMRHVRFACRAFPGDLQADAPADGFDLIVLSDMLHRLDAKALARAAQVTRSLLARGGHVQLVNACDPAGCPTSGHDAAEAFIASLRSVAPMLLQVRTGDFRIAVLQL